MSKCVFLAKVALKCCLSLCVVGKVVCLFYNNQHIRRMAFNFVNTGERVCIFMWRDCGRFFFCVCYIVQCFLKLVIVTKRFLAIALCMHDIYFHNCLSLITRIMMSLRNYADTFSLSEQCLHPHTRDLAKSDQEFTNPAAYCNELGIYCSSTIADHLISVIYT